tara:strand:+ start:531 stop:1595 length:1065 start_codon:yes stop_codon:yes gene_type:complete
MKYFTKIDQTLHPSLNKYKKRINLNNNNSYKNPKIDNKIINEILNNLEFRSADNYFGGAWEKIDLSSRKELIISLMQRKNLNQSLNNLFRNEFSFGLISSHWEQKNSKNWKTFLTSNILKNISSWEEFCMENENDYEYLDSKNDPGNPYGLVYKKKLVLFDTPRHDYFAKRIIDILKNHKNPLIVEIGGGYGGLLSQLLKRKFKFKYINIDLAQSLAVSYFFIRKKFQKKILFSQKINKVILKNNNIIFVPFSKNLFNNSKIKTSLVFNSNSFSEMDKSISKKYFEFINKKLIPDYLMHQNSNFLLFPKSKMHIEVQSREFNIDKKKFKQIYSFPSIFQGGSGRYREYLYKLND